MTPSDDPRSIEGRVDAPVEPTEAAAWLDAEERRLRSLAGGLQAAIDEIETTGGPASGAAFAQHPADRAAESQEREVDSALLGEVAAELAALHQARDRLAQGTYGRCEHCGEPIPVERLQAVPAARFCVRDEQRHELGAL